MIKKSEKAIKEMVQRIVEQFQPEKIILFESYARGTAGPDSKQSGVPGTRYRLICVVRTGIRQIICGEHRNEEATGAGLTYEK